MRSWCGTLWHDTMNGLSRSSLRGTSGPFGRRRTPSFVTGTPRRMRPRRRSSSRTEGSPGYASPPRSAVGSGRLLGGRRWPRRTTSTHCRWAGRGERPRRPVRLPGAPRARCRAVVRGSHAAARARAAGRHAPPFRWARRSCHRAYHRPACRHRHQATVPRSRSHPRGMQARLKRD